MENARNQYGPRETVSETIANSPGKRERSCSKAPVGENLEKCLHCGCVLKAEGTELIDVVLKKKGRARNEPSLGRRADKALATA